jgi:formylglycine-generating enzyme required for sulfatase activity
MDDRKGTDQTGVDFGATTPLIRPDGGTTPLRSPQQPSTRPQQAPHAGPPKRGIPVWVWILGGGGLLLLVAVVAVVIYFVIRQPGFTAVVRGAPPGSDVYVDNISRGATAADGSIKVTGLKAGKRVVRVSHEGYTDFNTTVSGKDGEVKSIVAQLVSTSDAPAGLPKEVDYGGPMLLVGAGQFTMGDDNHKPDEKPTHKITLPDFYIDKFEVTNEQYKKFCDATKHPYPTNPWWDDQYFSAHTRSPVLGISWDDAAAYASWAGKRLPKEEEWEKAASWDPTAQSKRQWPWGNTPDRSKANVGGTSRTTDVGQFASGASFYGVEDLAGNVGEWVDTFYQAYPGNQTSSPDFGTQKRVVRGGTYHGSIEDARTTRRLFHTPQLNEAEKKNKAFLIGFRCAIGADDSRIQSLLQKR